MNDVKIAKLIGLFPLEIRIFSYFKIKYEKIITKGIPHQPKFHYHSAIADPPIAKTVELIN